MKWIKIGEYSEDSDDFEHSIKWVFESNGERIRVRRVSLRGHLDKVIFDYSLSYIQEFLTYSSI